jgi:anti-anti-sigma factor
VIELSAEVTHPRHGAVVVTLKGDHDLGNADETGRLFDELLAENDLVVVDVGEVDFVDSWFVHTLIRADRSAREQGKRFRLQMGTARIVRRALELSGVLENLDVAHSREEALAEVEIR